MISDKRTIKNKNKNKKENYIFGNTFSRFSFYRYFGNSFLNSESKHIHYIMNIVKFYYIIHTEVYNISMELGHNFTI